MKTVTITVAKARLSALVEEVATTSDGVLITRRGRPMAKLIPAGALSRPHPADVKGWLADDDPFFESIKEILLERFRHKPRARDL
jgi:prevent-host-death family protein